MRVHAVRLLAVAILIAGPGLAAAETRTLSWDPVITYTDNTPIESGKTVAYTVYWSSDAALSQASLRLIASSLTQTSATFDVDAQGMTRGQTAYFTLKSVLSTGEESALSAAYAWNVPPLSGPTLSGLAIGGPSSVNEGGSAAYTATATWSDGTTTAASPSWSVSPSYATIGATGVLTAGQVTATQTVTVTASYTSGGATRTATKNVSVVDVPAQQPASPANLNISGPISIRGNPSWLLAWDPVSTYLDGAPVDPGRTVRYTAYWTTDPTLSAGTLRTLVSLTVGTSVEFDPASQGMGANQRVYFAARATLDTGAQSLLSGGPSWVASNDGPVPPAGAVIRRR